MRRDMNIDLQANLIKKMIRIRKKQGISQKQLSEMCGIKQSAIARIENMNNSPQINTLFKLLIPMRYKLVIVPITEIL